MTSVQQRLFLFLHTIAVFMLPMLLALATGGCVKREFNNELGPPVPCADIENEINSGLSLAYEKREVGQWVSMRESLAPLSQPPTVTHDIVQELLADDPHPEYEDTRLLTLAETTVTYGENGTQSVDTKEQQSPASAGVFGCPSDTPITFHNLKAETHFDSAPTKECTGDACRIQVKSVSFDLLIPTSVGEKERQRWQYFVSNDVPILSRELKKCRTGSTDVNGQKMPITICLEVREFGNDTPTP